MANEVIMVIDDYPDNLSILTQLLLESGYQVRPADSGKMALKSLQHGNVDLILLDIHMPEMDGYEVCHELKENPATRDIPVIFLSALSDPLDKVKAFVAGGVDYVTKPFNNMEVLARVYTHLQVRHLQQSLQRHNEELEARVAQRTASLKEANEALQKALQARNEFLMLVSHEFRTPLNGILGMASILEPYLSGQQLEFIYIIEQSGWQLLRLVDDMLKIVRTGSARLHEDDVTTQIVDIDQFCADSLQAVAIPAARKHISLDQYVGSLPLLEVPMEPPRLAQILGNLLDNAVKFSPEHGHVKILAAYDEVAQTLSLEVHDSAPSIALADRERIFEPFIQLEPVSTRHHEGAGLGLTLARNLAELHGGKILILEHEGSGNIFCLNLPAKRATLQAESTPLETG